MNDRTLKWIWLTAAKGMNSAKVTSLLNVFSDIDEIYNAGKGDYKNIELIRENDISLLSEKSLAGAEDIIKKLNKIGAYAIDFDDENYPNKLKKLVDPPYVIYVRGELPDFDNSCVSVGVVGTRLYSEYGAQVTKKMCFELAKNGFTIVSGMARGVDTFAAISALKAGEKTVAVLGCGVDVVYPPENVDLMKAIIKNGAVISEYPPMSQPLGFHFPERNRIIAALSDCLLVTEAPNGSGALITARRAYEMNVNIFAVPGSVFSANSVGTNNMIKAGIKAATCPKDITDEYEYELSKIKKNQKRNPIYVDEPIEKKDVEEKNVTEKKKEIKPEESLPEKKSAQDLSELSESERRIVNIIAEQGKISGDEIIRSSGLEALQVNQVLPLLEIMGIIKKLPGNYYILN